MLVIVPVDICNFNMVAVIATKLSATVLHLLSSSYLLIGTFSTPPMTNCSLEVSCNLVEWTEIGDDYITDLPDGGWLIDQGLIRQNYANDLTNTTWLFYRVKGTPTSQ